MNHPSSECELAPSSHSEPAILTTIYEPSIEPSAKEEEKNKSTLFLFFWNETAKTFNLHQINKITTKRKSKLSTRIKESNDFLEDFKKALKNIELSSFLIGKNNRSWKINFDWLLENDTNIVKVLEGKYNDQSQVADTDDLSKFGSLIKFGHLTSYDQGMVHEQS